MGTRPLRRTIVIAGLLTAATAAAGCHTCSLAEHDRVSVSDSTAGRIPCCGAAIFKDVSLMGRTSGAEFSLANNAKPSEPPIDAYLVPTSCERLFDAPYPGGSPLCTIFSGPAKPGGVSSRVKLDPGTYRVFLQGYSTASDAAPYLVDVHVRDYSCRVPII